MRLEVKIGNIVLKTPLVGASGLFGYGLEYDGLLDYALFGAIVTKTITLRPRQGNPPPRLVDIGCGLINSIGLENVGYEAFVEEKLPRVKLPCSLIVSIGGEKPDEFRRLADGLTGREVISGLEVNVSCPNVDKGGIAFGRDAEATHQVMKGVRSETDLTLIAKLPPLVSGIEEISMAACEGGADAITLANTYPAMAIDVDREKPALGGLSGGLSGRAIRPITLFLLWKVASFAKVPVIGSGGIEQAEHAVEYILAGASAFEIGSAILTDMTAPSKMIDGLRGYMEWKGYRSIHDFRGKARGGKEESSGRCDHTSGNSSRL